MVSINTNLSSLIVQNNLLKSTNALNTAIERMTTGYKINHSSDNAANYSIANNYNSKLSSLQVAEDNAMMGTDLVETASSTIEIMQNHAMRIRDLCEQAANGTYGEQSRQAIQAEIEAHIEEFERIKANAEYNGIDLFAGSVEKNIIQENAFIKDIQRLSEEEAIAQGYTPVSTVDELRTAMQNNKNICLMNDISITDPEFVYNYSNATLNGNGFKLTHTASGTYVYLIENASNVTIKNLELDSICNGASLYAALFRYIDGGVVDNCLISTKQLAGISGAVVAEAAIGLTIKDSYLSSGGIENYLIDIDNNGSAVITENVYHNGATHFDYRAPGLQGLHNANYSDVPFVGDVYTLDRSEALVLQIGINGDNSSNIKFSPFLNINSFAIDARTESGAIAGLSCVDDIISALSSKQTELGAVQNRLDSVIESIGVSIENLTSSLSTIKDADIAKESSAYIKAQILQQASATLLATANQSPSIALQLI